MRKRAACFMLFLLVRCLDSIGTFDMEEIRTRTYQIDFSDHNDFFNSKVEGNNENYADFEMTDHVGVKYRCSEQRQEEAQLSTKSTKEVYEQLIAASFYVQECITKNNGWWSYELCHGKHIVQKHRDNDYQVTEMKLGHYEDRLGVADFGESQPDRPYYVEEYYSKGTLCEKTGKPRSTIVRYYCGLSVPTEEAVITLIKENDVCSYIIHVKLGTLCKKREFVPPHQRYSSLIQCVNLNPGMKSPSVHDRLEKLDEKLENIAPHMAVIDTEWSSQRWPVDKRIAKKIQQLEKEEFDEETAGMTLEDAKVVIAHQAIGLRNNIHMTDLLDDEQENEELEDMLNPDVNIEN